MNINYFRKYAVPAAWSLMCILTVVCIVIAGSRVTVYMIGDSTMADKLPAVAPETGWGQVFRQFFDSTVTIENHAKNGRSSKSFRDEGLWGPVLDKLHEGDYVIIQFGHNDEKKEKPERYASPAEYGSNLRRYIREVRQHNAQPILCTPVVRRKFDNAGVLVETHSDYPDTARAVAREEQVPLIDLHKLTREMVASYGPDSSKSLYLWLAPGECPSSPDGKKDDTHFNHRGAIMVAGLAAREIRGLHIGLAGHLNSDKGE